MYVEPSHSGLRRSGSDERPHEVFNLPGCTLPLAGGNECTCDLLIEREDLGLATKFDGEAGTTDWVAHVVLSQQENYTSWSLAQLYVY